MNINDPYKKNVVRVDYYYEFFTLVDGTFLVSLFILTVYFSIYLFVFSGSTVARLRPNPVHRCRMSRGTKVTVRVRESEVEDGDPEVIPCPCDTPYILFSV